MSEIEWSPWIEHDGSDECPEEVKYVPMSMRHQSSPYNFGDYGDVKGGEWAWLTITHYRIPMEDYRRITGMPSWDYAPDWAKWLAQDENGRWWFYELEPEINGDCDCWDIFNDESSATSRSAGTVLGDWRVTECNDIKKFDWSNVNYDYYVREAEKLVNPLKRKD